VPRGLTRGRAGDILFALVMVAMALFAPPLGLLLCGYLAYRFDRDGDAALRNVALVCAVAALLFILFPFGIWAKVLDVIA
jgi:MFS family permease